ncbi:MAG: ABC transporter substrate-binding protein [Chloroflexi bacterium]|nr:ABC transporter substrate-binding protein [Chloroflexota bacterium]
MKGRIRGAIVGCVLVGLLSLGCTGAPAAAPKAAPEATTIRIAKQPGLGYLSLIVMREKKLVEKYAPGVQVQWNELTSGPAIRDAIIAGQLDVGSGGVGPFIQAWAKGVKWRAAGSMNDMPLFLNTNKPEISSLKDFKPGDKIAMPAPGSIQHVTMQMAAEKELGDPKALDGSVVAMAHPDALQALIAKADIVGHFTSPPFQYDELKNPGIKRILNSYEVVGGPHTFNLAWMNEEFKEKNPKLYQAFVDALKEATELINSSPEESARIYVEGEKVKNTPEDILAQIKSDGIRFTMTPNGLMKYAEFMQRTGTIEKAPSSWKELVFENIQNEAGS